MAKNLFNSIQLFKPKKNVFDLSHDVKMSMRMGELTPVMCTPVVPGDHFTIGCESLIRFAPLVAPVMHRFNVYVHYFFVPNRILWPNWENFITNTEVFDLPVTPPVSIITSGTYTRLMDYMGIPTPPPARSESVCALPFAAYQKIYNEYYRDQNLIDKVADTVVDGINVEAGLWEMRRRAWEHDYFTSSLPDAQKGASVDIPLGDVVLKGDWQDSGPPWPNFEDTAGVTNAGNVVQNITGDDEINVGTSTDPAAYNPQGSLETEPTTINDLRRAFRLQEWLEKNMRAGTRYVENILGHFGVRSSDKRLQRPEYITGVKSPIVISEVLNTTGTEELPQGNMSGHGVSVVQGKYGKYFCEEHGYIMGIMSIMPKTAYQQGLAKHWIKTDPLDYYWPSFAHIGEQEVQAREVYAFQAGTSGNDTFGYVPRYAEYKFENNRVAGQFRTTFNTWHAGRIFDDPPTLNQAFVECTPTTRIFAVTDDNIDNIFCHVYNKVRAVRPMPKFGTPMF